MDDDESFADDGAVHHFWRFVLARRLRRLPEFNLETVEGLRAAVEAFEAEEPHP